MFITCVSFAVLHWSYIKIGVAILLRTFLNRHHKCDV